MSFSNGLFSGDVRSFSAGGTTQDLLKKMAKSKSQGLASNPLIFPVLLVGCMFFLGGWLFMFQGYGKNHEGITL